ncbi:hypothetical protein [Pectinatus sottacetonis]|uniref:hypothetical protein n=1 Tax=Pectinatus sottacetonis TaxID=1002795 RepID=UPI0018C52579|nr:hypothetical protein [Pectinatus sottacetonis]
MHKNKRTILLIGIVIIAGILLISAKEFSLLDTSAADSLKIFTQINLQNNFTNANKIGLGDKSTISTWQENYLKINKHYFQIEFKNTLPDEKLTELVNAELAMNKKRKIEINDVKIKGDTATVKISISKTNYSEIVDTAVKKTAAAKKAGKISTPKEYSSVLADELINGYKTAKISNEMSSFSIVCKKDLITNTKKKYMQHSDDDWVARYILPRFTGHCWYPQNMDEFFEKLNKAIET